MVIISVSGTYTLEAKFSQNPLYLVLQIVIFTLRICNWTPFCVIIDMRWGVEARESTECGVFDKGCMMEIGKAQKPVSCKAKVFVYAWIMTHHGLARSWILILLLLYTRGPQTFRGAGQISKLRTFGGPNEKKGKCTVKPFIKLQCVVILSWLQTHPRCAASEGCFQGRERSERAVGSEASPFRPQMT